jgi:hypothetical protein
VSVVSQNATLPVAFSPNDDANNSTAVSLFKLIAVRCRLRGLILEPTRQLLAYQLVESWSLQPIEIALAASGLSKKMFGDFQSWHGSSIWESRIGENFV